MDGLYFYTGIIGFACGVVVTSVFEVGFVHVLWVVVVAWIVWVVARRNRVSSTGGTTQDLLSNPPNIMKEDSQKVYSSSKEAISSGNLVLVSIFLIAGALGMIRFEIASFDEVNQVYEQKIDTKITLEGVVAREPDVREKSTHLYVRVEDELLLVKTNRYTDISYGDLVKLEGMLQKPSLFETDLGRTFDYPNYLQARGVSYSVSFAQVTVLAENQGNVFIEKILEGKQRFMHVIEQIIPEPQVGLAEGLLLGVKQALGDELEAVFRKTGIIHIVVLSGYNVTLVVLFTTYMLSYILPYRARIPFGIIAIILFAILVGLSATVVRASVMAALILYARAAGRTYAIMRALMFAGLVMVLINPYLLVYDVGFQLSFLATLGLILLAPYIESKIQFFPNILQSREFLTATVATQIFVMPILLYNIGEFSVVSVLVNVLVLPMVPVAMFLTFITGMVGLVYMPLASLIGFATHISLSYILIVATFFAKVPFASVSVSIFPFSLVVASYGLMGYGLYRLYGKQTDKNKHKEVLLPQWTLEEEADVAKRLKENSITRADGVMEKIPKFFR